MEVVTWDGGQFLHEIEAIEKIKKTFSAKEKLQLERLGKKKVSLAELQSKPSGGNRNESMLPWKGYAGFRFVGRKGQEGEFDLVIVTDCNVIIIELKDWNNGKVTASGGKWYKNGRQMGTSPVKVTQNKAHLLKSKLERYKSKLPRRQVPRIEFLVVMTGNADFSSLPDVDALHTVSLEEFLSLKDIYKFNKRFTPHPDSRVLNQYFSVFDLMLKGKEVKPKQLVVHGYEAVEEIFEHPQQLYREFEAINVSRKNDAALLRLWDFNKSGDKTLGTPEGRFEVVSREQEVLNHIRVHDQDLYNRCLRSLTNVQPEDVTTEYAEVYELPFNHTRFNEAVGKYVVNFSESDRYNLLKLLVAKFADLHKLKIAHRDIGDHSIWISPGREIALSGFISAYYPSAKTVGVRREELSVNSHDAPFGMHQDEHTTPFQIDVYTLAVLGWHILQGLRISKDSIQSLIDQVTESTAWYTETFAKAIFATSQDQYKDAIQFYEALNSAEPNNERLYDFDDIELDPYRKNLRLSRTYREDDLIQESAIKEIYRSDSFIVKSWLKIDPDESQPGLGRQVFHFCERLSRLKGLSPDYLPKIHDFGLAGRDSCLFLIQEFIEGASWDEINFDDWEQDTKFDLINKLIMAVEHLHNLDEYHGDLKPENIKIYWQSKELKLYLLDMPDFCVSGDIPMNHAYSPENIDSCTPQVRDNYAAMRMCYELLGENWDAQEGSTFEYLRGNIEQEKKDYESGFQSLVRFKQALKQELNPKVSDHVVSISCRNGSGLTIYPDNGDLYANVEIGRNAPNSVMLQLAGVGGSVSLIYSTITKSVEHCFEPRVRDTPHRNTIETSQFSLSFGIRIDQQAYKDFGDLESQLNTSELFQSVVADILSPSSDENDQASISNEVIPAIHSDSAEGTDSSKDSISQIHIDKLWRTILQTETESLPSIEFSGDIENHQGRNEERQLHIAYSSDSDVLEKYDAFDKIEALIVGEDKDITLGEVVLKDSSSEVLCLKKFNNKAAKSLGDGESIYLRTTKDKSSYIRRKKAMERILDKGSIISNLSDYFDPACTNEPSVLLDAPSDEDFSRYDREDDHGNQISLNPQQRSAFKKLVQNGPVSLLQGPPGTGKTEFIAAFSHYLVEKEQVKNILLVSQSHEAVNTAAERIRKHCQKLQTPLDVVRFSNREGAVSDPLRDVYRGSLKTEFRELFITECKKRVGNFSRTLGVQRAYLEELVDIEFLISSRIQSIRRAQESLEKDELDDKVREALSTSIADSFESLRALLLEQFSLVLNEIGRAHV